jgi:hypothetical protein
MPGEVRAEEEKALNTTHPEKILTTLNEIAEAYRRALEPGLFRL